MWKHLGIAFPLIVVMTVLTCFSYPGGVTGLCQYLFLAKANGSLISFDGHIVGSSLIGQNFSKPGYFTGGSNYGPTNQRLINRVKASIAKFRKDNPDYKSPNPADLVTASPADSIPTSARPRQKPRLLVWLWREMFL